MFKNSCFTRIRSRVPANSKDGAICNNILQLKSVYYSIITRSTTLNVDRGAIPACYSYAIRIVIRMCSYVIHMSLLCTRTSSHCHSYVLACHPYATCMYSMSLVCQSYVLVCHTYVTRLWFYNEPSPSV